MVGVFFLPTNGAQIATVEMDQTGSTRIGAADLAAALDNLVRGARARKVPPEELRGHTITLSNYGTIAGRYPKSWVKITLAVLALLAVTVAFTVRSTWSGPTEAVMEFQVMVPEFPTPGVTSGCCPVVEL